MAKIELYDTIETKASLETLDVLAERLPKPIILLGGWAVYFLVNESYQKELGFTYLGSRDVDIGFHIPKDVTEFDLRTGNFKPAIEILKRMGYKKEGASRFCRTIDKRTGETVVGNTIDSMQGENLFHLFVDPIVDYSHPLLSDFEDITPIEEPILTKAVLENKFKTIKIGKGDVKVPEPDILLEMKISSLPKRTRLDKKLKDICDIYSLIWHSEKPFIKVITPVKEDCPELIMEAKPSFSDEIKKEAIYYLGIELAVFEGVMKNLFE